MLMNHKGFSLLESLISLIVISAGLLMLGRFQANLLSAGANAKERAQATMYTGQLLNQLKATSWSTLKTYVCPTAASPTSITGTNFKRYCTLDTSNSAFIRVTVTTTWVDSSNVTNSTSLATIVSGTW